MDNWSGRNIKGYQLQERIGTGGFGAVYRAEQSTIGREVAMKIILPHFANHPDFIRRFETEAQLVARLEHLHIVPLYDYWRDPDGAYLVMRWLRGGSLRDVLTEKPFEFEAAALLLDQITAALAVAHRNDVIHCDIKPGNILLDEDGNAYLTDFGIAKDVSSPGLAEVGAIVGSPDYLAPEQASNEPVTPRTDIYSLGVVLYELLVGQHPFPTLNVVERLYSQLNDPLPAITSLPEDVRESVNTVIQKATAKNPGNRYPDAMSLSAAFREAIQMRPPQNLVETLTQREQDILSRIIAGQSNRQIADALVVTVGTVKWYVNQIFRKLNVRSRVQAIVRARELNLIVTSGDSASPLAQVPAMPTEDFRPENPYKGLRAFQSADYQDFYGRETLTEKLLERLGEKGEFARFLAVVGPSGSGKSSLIKAGLIPALWRGALPGSEKWFVVEMLPGSHPLDELEVALTRIAANQVSHLNEHLRRDKRGLVRSAGFILPDDGSELVVVIDQFEEVFTLVAHEAERVHFLDLLHTAVTETRSRVRVVVTLRADFYDRPLHYPAFGELVRSRMETILPLSAEELERAITRPAECAGVTFEPGLVAKMIGEVNYQPGALPLLQYALTELFEQRQGRLLTHESYQAIGGTVGALAKRADELYDGLNEQGRENARQMFLRLVTLGEGVEDTRRRVARSELLAITDDSDLMDDVVDIFAAYRLLSLDHDPATRSPTVELAHEAILREWERLRRWLTESRDEIKLQRQLAAMAADWREAHQDASFLARGSRLEQFETWAADTKLVLTGKEREYLDASLAERSRQAQAEMQRQAREKALERRSVRFLRVLVAVLLLATLGALGLVGVAMNQRQIAERNVAEAQNVALVAGSQSALANGNTDEAIALALQAIRLDPDSARAQVALGQAAYAPGTIRRFVIHTGAVWSVAFNPDGETAVSAGDDQILILWDLQSGGIIRRFEEGHAAGHIKLAFSPDGRQVISGADDGQVILWDVETGQIVRHFEGHTGWIGDVEFSPDGRAVLSCGQDKTVILWDVATGNVIQRFEGHTESVESVALSADGNTMLSGSDDNTLMSWDLTTGEILHQFGGEGKLSSIDLSHDGHYAVVGSWDTFVYLWDITTGRMIHRFQGHTGPVSDVKFSPDGHQILSAADDGSLILWDVATEQLARHLVGHTARVNDVAFSSDGRYALSGASDQTIRLWDLESGQIIRHFAGHDGWIPTVKVSPDGLTALTSSWAGTASLWDLQTGQKLHHLTEPTQLNNLAYSPDSRTALIAVGNEAIPNSPGGVILWDLTRGEVMRRFTWNQGIFGVDFSPDGRTFVSGGADGLVLLWDVATGEVIRRFEGHTALVPSVSFNPDGRTILSGARNGEIVLWDVEMGQLVRRFVGQADLVAHITFSKDGRKVMTPGSVNGTNLWDVATGTLARHLDGGAIFSPDGRTIFGYSGRALGANSAVLLDSTTGTLLRHFNELDRFPISNAFLLDGRSVLVGYSNGKLEQWRIDSLDDLIAWTQANRYIPELTCKQRALYRLDPPC